MTVKELRKVLDLATKSLAAVTTELRVEMKDVPKAADLLILKNLCMTREGVNSDEAALLSAIEETEAGTSCRRDGSPCPPGGLSLGPCGTG